MLSERYIGPRSVRLKLRASRNGPSPILVYEPDGVNPYGRELARLLAELSLDVSLLVARDASWVPDRPSARRCLPRNLRSAKLLQLWWLQYGILAAIYGVLVSRRTLVVVWTRSVIEDLVFAVLAAAGLPVVVVAHNPSPRGNVKTVRRWSQRMLTNTASAVVVHSDQLARRFPSGAAPRRLFRCSHPPFSGWAAQPLPGERRKNFDDPPRLLFLGSLRPDKGASLLPKVLSHLPEGQRQRVVLAVCGRGTVPPELRSELSAIGVTLDDMTSECFLPDHKVRRALAQAFVLLAPYVGATQSSTVAAALAMGVPVLAFDEGAISDIVTDGGLVPSGDTQAMGFRLGDALAGLCELGRPVIDAAVWEAACADEWMSVLDQVSASR